MCVCVYLAEGGHERGDLAVVCRVHVGAGVHQQLHHVKMAAVGRQPEGRVPFLVAHVDLSAPGATEGEREREVRVRTSRAHSTHRARMLGERLEQQGAGEGRLGTHLLMRSSQNL